MEELDKVPILVRWMGWSDLHTVLEIEEAVAAKPWRWDDFQRRVRRQECTGVVAEAGGQVSAFAVYLLRRATMQLVRLGVHPDSCRFDVIPRLLEYMKLASYRHGMSRITVFVPERDITDQQIFNSEGFRPVGMQSGRFTETGKGSFLMSYEFVSERSRSALAA